MENIATKTENRPTGIRIIRFRRGWEFRYRNSDGDMVRCAQPYASAQDAAQALAYHLESIEKA